MKRVSSCDTSSPPTTVRAESSARFAAGTEAEREGMSRHQRTHRRHHDLPEAQQTALVNGVVRAFAVMLRLDGEINHHDGVFLHDADEHDEADETIDVQIQMKQHQCQQRAEARRGQAGQNGQRMDETFVKGCRE